MDKRTCIPCPENKNKKSDSVDNICTNHTTTPHPAQDSILEDVLVVVCVLLVVVAFSLRAMGKGSKKRGHSPKDTYASNSVAGKDSSRFTPVRIRHDTDAVDLNDPLMQKLLKESAQPDQASWMASSEHLEFLEAIAQGSYGRVYRGEYFGSVVAIKEISSLQMGDTEDGEKEHQSVLDLKQEIKMLSSLHHASIVHFYGVAPGPQGVAYLITEYCPNDLKTLIYAGDGAGAGISDPQKFFEYYTQICRAMHFLHGKGIIHRDLKPSNVLVSEQGKIKLCDFGLSCVHDGTMTHTSGAGTPLYMAPEVIKGHNNKTQYSLKIDVYSFGVLGWEMWCAKKPFGCEANGQSVFSMMKKICAGLRPELTDDFPPSLCRMFEVCWSKRPTARPSFHNITLQMPHLESVTILELKQKNRRKRGPSSRRSSGSISLRKEGGKTSIYSSSESVSKEAGKRQLLTSTEDEMKEGGERKKGKGKRRGSKTWELKKREQDERREQYSQDDAQIEEKLQKMRAQQEESARRAQHEDEEGEDSEVDDDKKESKKPPQRPRIQSLGGNSGYSNSDSDSDGAQPEVAVSPARRPRRPRPRVKSYTGKSADQNSGSGSLSPMSDSDERSGSGTGTGGWEQC
jgi:serine/threonine protein kinase